MRQARTGTRRDMTSWTAWPVVFEDAQGENSMMIEVFRDQLPEGVKPGAEGWLIYNMSVFMAQNGGLYNQVRFVKFEPVARQSGAQSPATGAETAPESPQTAQGVQTTMPFDENAPALI